MRGRGFVERSIAGVLESLEHALSSEELARSDGLAQSVDPRVKVAGALALIVATVTSRKLTMIAAIFAVAVLFALLSKVPMRTLVGRVWLGAFLFTGTIAIPAIFLTPGNVVWRAPLLNWPITAEGLRSAAYLVSRVETCATLSLLLVLSTPWNHVLKALRVFRVPVVIVVILGMTYRYILLMLTMALDMFESRQSRMVGVLAPRDRRRLAIGTAGVLLAKTLQLSGDVYSAMLSRGFRGEVYLVDDFQMRTTDWTASAVLTTLAALAFFGGR